MERRLGRSLTDEVMAKPLTWGTLLEDVVFQLLGTDYKLCSSETIDHPKIEFWKGTPDAQKFDEGLTAVEIKCPYTLESFCGIIDAFEDGGMEQARKDHRDADKWYWQTVSHACLMDAKYGELIVYCPYQEDLEELREYAANFDGGEQYKFFWIHMAHDAELPHLKKGGYYKSLNIMRFEIPKKDKVFLTNRILAAGKELVEFHKK